MNSRLSNETAMPSSRTGCSNSIKDGKCEAHAGLGAKKAGITADTKLDCEASEDAGVIAVYPASYRHDLTDVPRSILQCLLASGHSLYALNDILTAESENSDAE